jgi:hypothetical protein
LLRDAATPGEQQRGGEDQQAGDRDRGARYPHSLIWRGDNPHPALSTLRGHLSSAPLAGAGTWTPTWAGRTDRRRDR